MDTSTSHTNVLEHYHHDLFTDEIEQSDPIMLVRYLITVVRSAYPSLKSTEVDHVVSKSLHEIHHSLMKIIRRNTRSIKTHDDDLLRRMLSHNDADSNKKRRTK